MSTSSANALGLPNRRLFLGNLAAAGTLGLPALPALAAAPGHIDDELLKLDAQIIEATLLAADLGEQSDEAYERFVPPPMPEALFWRKTDFMRVWIDRSRLDSVGNPDDGTERYTYASHDVLLSLKARRAEWRAVAPIDLIVGPDAIARVEEIIAHLEAYEIEEMKRFAECGYAAAQRAFEAQSAVVEDLSARIAALPARTAEGACVKVRAALHASWCNAEAAEQSFAALLAKSERLPTETAELLSLSAMVDAARLGGASSGDRRAA